MTATVAPATSDSPAVVVVKVGNCAFAILPTLWFLVYWTTCIAVVVVSVRKKYVRHKIPIICTAGAKDKAHTMFIVGNVVSSCLLIATLWLWVHVVNQRKNQSFGDPTLGGIFGTLAALFFIAMAWYSVVDYKMRHDLLALVSGIATYIQSGFMIGAAKKSQHALAGLWGVRLSCFLVGLICLSVGTLFVQHAVNMKEAQSAKTRPKVDLAIACENENAGGENDNDEKQQQQQAMEDVVDDLAIFMSSSEIIKPWDKFVVWGALLRYVAMMAYSGLTLTTIPDLLPQTVIVND